MLDYFSGQRQTERECASGAIRAPAPDFAASSRRACVPPFLRLNLIFREPYMAEAVTSLNAGIEGHHYSCGPQVTA
jgi:hypothetical protein